MFKLLAVMPEATPVTDIIHPNIIPNKVCLSVFNQMTVSTHRLIDCIMFMNMLLLNPAPEDPLHMRSDISRLLRENPDQYREDRKREALETHGRLNVRILENARRFREEGLVFFDREDTTEAVPLAKMTDYYASGRDPAPTTEARRNVSPPARLPEPSAAKAPSLFQAYSAGSVSSEPSPLQAEMLSGRATANFRGEPMSTAAPTKAVARNPSDRVAPKDTLLERQDFVPRFSQQSSHSAHSIPQRDDEEEK